MTIRAVRSYLSLAGIGLAICGLLTAQAPERVAFDVASVKRDLSGGAGGAIRLGKGGLFTSTNSTLQGLIRYAYGVRDYQIQGPGWMNTERYDIEAKAAGERDDQAIRPMLQNLLAERFGLKLRREVRQMPVYALVVTKGGPKLRESKPADSTSVGSTNHSVVATKLTLQDLATALSAQLDRPVLDSTGLEGTFDINIEWTPDMGTAETAPAGASLFTILQDQVGLRLESRTGPVEVLIIDHAEKIPEAN